ncbi:unnamed protein product, partial [Pleuronectes platessa]
MALSVWKQDSLLKVLTSTLLYTWHTLGEEACQCIFCFMCPVNCTFAGFFSTSNMSCELPDRQESIPGAARVNPSMAIVFVLTESIVMSGMRVVLVVSRSSWMFFIDAISLWLLSNFFPGVFTGFFEMVMSIVSEIVPRGLIYNRCVRKVLDSEVTKSDGKVFADFLLCAWRPLCLHPRSCLVNPN